MSFFVEIKINYLKIDVIALGAKFMGKSKNNNNNHHANQNVQKFGFLDFNKDGRVDAKGFKIFHNKINI